MKFGFKIPIKGYAWTKPDSALPWQPSAISILPGIFLLEIHGCTNFSFFLSAPISPLPGKFWMEVYIWLNQPWFCPVSPNQHINRKLWLEIHGWNNPDSALLAPISPPPRKLWLEIHVWTNPDSVLSAPISPLQGKFWLEVYLWMNQPWFCIQPPSVHYQRNFGWKSIHGWTNPDSAMSAPSAHCQGKLWLEIHGWLYPVTPHQNITREKPWSKSLGWVMAALIVHTII